MANRLESSMLDSMPKAVSVPWMPSFANVYLRPVSYMPPIDTLAAQTADDAAAARSAAQAAQPERGKYLGLNVIIWRSLVWFDWRKAGLVTRCLSVMSACCDARNFGTKD